MAEPIQEGRSPRPRGSWAFISLLLAVLIVVAFVLLWFGSSVFQALDGG